MLRAGVLGQVLFGYGFVDLRSCSFVVFVGYVSLREEPKQQALRHVPKGAIIGQPGKATTRGS